MEPLTVITAAGAFGAGKLVDRVLGPKADDYGIKLKELLSKNGRENVEQIIRKSYPKLETENPKLDIKSVRDLIQEGAFCNDEVEAEYRAGIFASAASKGGEGGFSPPFSAMVSRLPPIALVLHYIFYSYLKKVCDAQEVNAALGDQLSRARIFVESAYLESVIKNLYPTFSEKWFSNGMRFLEKEGLITGSWAAGGVEHIVKSFPQAVGKIKSAGVVFHPTSLGCELYLWANGSSNILLQDFFSQSWVIKPIDSINVEDNHAVRIA